MNIYMYSKCNETKGNQAITFGFGFGFTTVQLGYKRTTHTRILRMYVAYTRMSIHAYIHVRARVSLLCVPISFFV